ncbi:hypothetical protein HK405_001891, partial [Cladochytrium tenue]
GGTTTTGSSSTRPSMRRCLAVCGTASRSAPSAPRSVPQRPPSPPPAWSATRAGPSGSRLGSRPPLRERYRCAFRTTTASTQCCSAPAPGWPSGCCRTRTRWRMESPARMRTSSGRGRTPFSYPVAPPSRRGTPTRRLPLLLRAIMN